ncbi:MAG: trypsin-like peptidase domain-containing protein, partial [Oscillospiraceae bacterium]|nr:trypsin-like peptidase domain-containing protein [Oscillospiraceae bacterium]
MNFHFGFPKKHKGEYHMNNDDKKHPQDFNDGRMDDFEDYIEKQPSNQKSEWNTVYDSNRDSLNRPFVGPSGEYHYSYQKNNSNAGQNPSGSRQNRGNEWRSATSSPIDPRTMHSKAKQPNAANFFLVAIGSLIVLLLVSFGAYKISLNLTNQKPNEESNGESSVDFLESIKNPESLSPQEIFKRCSKSVVSVEVSLLSELDESVGCGSGVIISPEHIVTNNHVVELGGNARSDEVSVSIKLHDGKVYQAKVLGTDVKTDLAVLQLKNDEDKLDSAVTFRNPENQIEVGEAAIAIGNPQTLSNTMTKGVVSAKDRILGDYYCPFIQIDTAINQGNSGGGLFDITGSLIGIPSVKITDNEGLGFAIPSSVVKDVANQIISKGRVTNRAALGIKHAQISDKAKQIYNIPPGAILIAAINNNSIEAAGVRVKDVITKINGIEIKNMSTIYS